jgi:cyclopropane-fatty-acyl-phospholipid synthase
MLGVLIDLMERGYLPDPTIRWGVRRLCRQRLAPFRSLSTSELRKITRDFARELRESPVAIATKEANEQHYEVPARFYELVLGPHLKYSCAFWSETCLDLAMAEREALEITMARAQLKNGQRILELGCGWGSLTLTMAERFPHSQITAVSNSNSQRESIMKRAAAKGLKNVQVLTRDLGTTVDLGEGQSGFDRIVSVEMFEHIRNYAAFFERLKSWLGPDGKMFVHVFTHKSIPYAFETEGDDNWMGRYFFTGGQMPSKPLFEEFQDHFSLLQSWDWSGTHYQKTSEAWLANMDQHRDEILQILTPVYGEMHVARWVQRWRVFFISVAELFGYRQGTEWGVTHYLFEKKKFEKKLSRAARE